MCRVPEYSASRRAPGETLFAREYNHAAITYAVPTTARSPAALARALWGSTTDRRDSVAPAANRPDSAIAITRVSRPVRAETPIEAGSADAESFGFTIPY